MQPFFNSTRATMISCPTTNCRCSSGFSSSSGMVCQGIYCKTAVPAACLVTARLAREWETADFALARVAVLVFALVFSFFFGMLFLFLSPRWGLIRYSAVPQRLAPLRHAQGRL